jgi:hypothetical protein
MAGCDDDSKEHSYILKRGEFLELMKMRQLPETDFAPWIV